MLRIALKGVAAHKLRLAMTSLAIVLGVAFVSGTFVFTDTINARFETLFDDIYSGIDATVRPVQPEFGTPEGQPVGSLPESLLADVLAVDGVEQAAGSAGGFAQIVSPEGDPIGGQGPPTIGFTWIEIPALSPVSIADGNGRAPSGPLEVAIDIATADGNDFALGDSVEIQTMGGTETFEVVGLVNFGTEDNVAGATLSIFSLDEGQRLFDLDGRFSTIDVIAAEGVQPDELVGNIESIIPADSEVATGEQQAQEEIGDVTTGLGFLTTALLAFAGVAVFVGGFVIQNTFRIIVAQRTRELALLRAVGATGRQVTTLVALESLVVAVISSAIGVASGIGIATLLKAVMSAVGIGLPDGPLTVEPRTIVVGMTVGVVVTLISAIIPARKAAKVPPVAALTDHTAPSSFKSLRGRTIGGTALVGIGSALLAIGLLIENGSSLTLVGAGSLTIFVGVSVLAPLFAIPIARVLGKPLPGVTGDLARENTIRQPRRTASTAAALMIGVALVSFVSIFAASITASVTETLEGAFPADLAFASTNFQVGVSEGLEVALETHDEFEVVSPIRTGIMRIDGEELNVAAVDGEVGRVYSFEPTIEPAAIGDGVLVQTGILDKHGWSVGETIDIEYAATGFVPTTIIGTFEDQTFANYIVSDGTYSANFTNEDATIVFARLADGVELTEGSAVAEGEIASYPNVDMNTRSEQIAEAEAQVDQLVALFSGLLGLAVIIALMGIANTLALSIVERTREIGLLRAIGMSRRQVRRMIRWEAIIIALFGAILGIVVGTGLGWATVASLADNGLGSFAFPAGSLAIWLVLAGVAGVIAAIGPARKASRMNVLQAISYE